MQKHYTVFRIVAGVHHVPLREHILSFDTANEYANAMAEKTHDKCYVVEYAHRAARQRHHNRQ